MAVRKSSLEFSEEGLTLENGSFSIYDYSYEPKDLDSTTFVPDVYYILDGKKQYIKAKTFDDTLEYFENKFQKKIETSHLIEFAKIISWNIWQMDGIKFVVPESCSESVIEQTLFGEEIISKECEGCKKGNNFNHNGIYCKIMDWKTHKTIRYVDLLR